EALDQFMEAYDIYPSPILQFNIGYCQRSLGQYVAALETLRKFVSHASEGLAATRRGEAEGYVAELEARVPWLGGRVPPNLRSGSELLVDGVPVALDESGGVRMRANPGHHVVQVRRPGYSPAFIDRDVRAGQEERLLIKLEQLPARLVVASKVLGARVSVDG